MPLRENVINNAQLVFLMIKYSSFSLGKMGNLCIFIIWLQDASLEAGLAQIFYLSNNNATMKVKVMGIPLVILHDMCSLNMTQSKQELATEFAALE